MNELLNLRAYRKTTNMFKNIFFMALVAAFALNGSSTIAQNKANPDGRLLSKFSKKELSSLTAKDLSYWTYYIDNCYEIADIPKQKLDGVPEIVALKSLEKKDINVFELGIVPHEFARNYLRIEGTDKMIVILGQTEIESNYKALVK
ncbi:MAG: hypothetical protein K9J17_10740 [Flavobacteriales bacterium]|nr:hypothetical protein [Flavobacteriales bacterium]